MAIQDLHISRLKIDNYKSLKDSEIELKAGLNIVIGKNGAGKSNLLEFISKYTGHFPFNFLRDLRKINSGFSISFACIQGTQELIFSYEIEKIKSDSRNDLSSAFQLTFDKTKAGQNIDRGEKILFGSGVVDVNAVYKADQVLKNGFQIFRNISIWRISFAIPENIFWVSSPGKIVIDRNSDDSVLIEDYSDFGFLYDIQIQVKDFESLLNDGKNSANSIKIKINNYLQDYVNNSLINSLLERYSIIKKIRFNPNINVYIADQKIIIENLYIDFLIDEEWIPWSYLSDGTKRLFYLISQSVSLREGVLLIEEPELGIHPHQLYKIMDFLKEQSRHKQIIISTHSPLVLDALNENELDRIIIAKYDNGTKFNHLSEEQIAKAKKYMNEVGELSYYWLHSDLEE